MFEPRVEGVTDTLDTKKGAEMGCGRERRLREP